MKIGDRCFVHGYIDEIRKDTVIIRNTGGYFGTDISEVICGSLPERKTGRWIETEGLDEEIRCTMCTNPMRSDRGCDGSCQYDEKLYKQIMSIIKDRIDGGGA